MIERIFTRAPSGGPLQEQQSVALVAGAGVVGDRYFGRQDEPGQNLTLIEAEAIERFQAAQGWPTDLSVTGRNLVTRGVRLNAFVGQTFRVGGIRVRGVELCEPCMGLGEQLARDALTPAGVVKALVHAAGLRVDVLDSGTISVGMMVG
jgi:MOSC domain-containing protein YiiM